MSDRADTSPASCAGSAAQYLAEILKTIAIVIMLPLLASACGLQKPTNTEIALGLVHDSYITPISYPSLLGTTFAGLKVHEVALGASGKGILSDADAHLTTLPADDRGQALSILFDTFSRLHAAAPDISVSQLDLWAVEGLLGQIDDGTGFESLASGQDNSASIGLGLMEIGASTTIAYILDDSPAAKAGLQPMEALVRVDGIPVINMSPRKISEELRGTSGSIVNLSVRQPGSSPPLDFSVRREILSQPVPKSARDGDILILSVPYAIGDQTLPTLKRLYHQASAAGPSLKGVILDLRFNGGGLMTTAVELAGALLPPGTPLGSIIARTPDNTQVFRSKDGDITAGLPMIVLVNGVTSEGAEFVARALQDAGRATVIGCPTAGAGRLFTFLPLSATGAAIIFSGRLVGADGTDLQSHPIRPKILPPSGCLDLDYEHKLTPFNNNDLVNDETVRQAAVLLRTSNVSISGHQSRHVSGATEGEANLNQ